jgi:hypothetical protein
VTASVPTVVKAVCRIPFEGHPRVHLAGRQTEREASWTIDTRSYSPALRSDGSARRGPEGSMKVDDFIALYRPMPPRRPLANIDEARLLVAADGLERLGPAPAANKRWYQPNRKGDPECHLWVIDTTGIPYIFERSVVVPPLQSGRVTHTNLTGGLAASCGGELWFDTPNARRLYVNGCSGRYGPTTPEELEHAVSVFRTLDYEVISFGWDDGTNLPRTVLP